MYNSVYTDIEYTTVNTHTHIEQCSSEYGSFCIPIYIIMGCLLFFSFTISNVYYNIYMLWICWIFVWNHYHYVNSTQPKSSPKMLIPNIIRSPHLTSFVIKKHTHKHIHADANTLVSQTHWKCCHLSGHHHRHPQPPQNITPYFSHRTQNISHIAHRIFITVCLLHILLWKVLLISVGESGENEQQMEL